MKIDIIKLYKASGSKIAVLKNMIDDKRAEITSGRDKIRQELKVDKDAIVIGSVGTLNWIKNYKVLIESFFRLDRKDVFLVLVGSGPLKENLEAHVRSLGLNSRVRFTGYRQDVVNILNALDIFALTSFNEGLPISLLEAASLGLPCVATRVGGVPEVLKDGITGKTVSSNNAEELTRAFNWIISNLPTAKQMGIAARQNVLEKFKPADYIDKVLQIYNADFDNN